MVAYICTRHSERRGEAAGCHEGTFRTSPPAQEPFPRPRRVSEALKEMRAGRSDQMTLSWRSLSMKRRDRKAISAGIFISCTVVTHRMHRETAKMCRWQLYNNKLHATGWCKNGLRAIETLSSRNRKAEETSALRRSFLIFARCRTLVDQTPILQLQHPPQVVHQSGCLGGSIQIPQKRVPSLVDATCPPAAVQ